jgi:hypothetical protein
MMALNGSDPINMSPRLIDSSSSDAFIAYTLNPRGGVFEEE